jgi:hypothetical protein
METSVNQQVRERLRAVGLGEFGSVDTWRELLYEFGFNDEQRHELPQEVWTARGMGLRIWQYPNQFAPYMAWLCSQASSIGSYLEIGTRHGGTFITHVETLRRLNPKFERAVAVDLMQQPEILAPYEYRRQDSQSAGFLDWVGGQMFDLVFIDGDHSYAAVRRDAESTFARCNIQVLHDITSDICPGVGTYWREYKQQNGVTHDFREFTDQYESVNGSFLGIGVACRRDWIE